LASPVSIADVQNAIRDGVADLGAVGSRAVVWSDEERPAVGVVVVLTIVQLGSDHDREEYSADEDDDTQLVWQLSTLQYLRVQVRVESQYNAPGRDALFTAEKIRAGLRRPDLVWDAGVINKPDVNTYMHHVPFVHNGRVVSAWAFETNFRAVTDFSLDGPLPAGANMQQVETIGADAEPPVPDQTIDRPAPAP
jgi:hypothetical protein